MNLAKNLSRLAGLVWLFLAVELHAEAMTPDEENTPLKQPNVIIILADDMGWNDPGFMGSQYHATPNLDKLAKQSSVYHRAYAASPSCTPSRAALISGQYPSRFNIFTVGQSNNGPEHLQRFKAPQNRNALPNNIITLPQIMKNAGYHTALIGKWHLNPAPGRYFDRVIGTFKQGHVPSHFAPFPDTLADSETLPARQGDYLTDLLNQAAVNFIKQQTGEQPFNLLLSHYAPHTPYQAKAEDKAAFVDKDPIDGHRNPTYAGMLAAIDRGVGQILTALENTGQLENTIIIFTSDNGSDHVVTSAKPLRGEKSMLYEGGIRVPLLIYAPAYFTVKHHHQAVSHVDLLPTLASLAGVETKLQTDGVNLLQTIAEDRTLFWYAPVYAPGYSPDSNHTYYRQTPAIAAMQGNWKLLLQYETYQHELYNLENDPAENQNLFGQTEQQAIQKTLEHQVTLFFKNLPISTRLENNPQWNKVSFFSKTGSHLKLQAQIEFALFTDWLASLYWGDKTALHTLKVLLAITGFFLLCLVIFLFLKFRRKSPAAP